MSTQIRNRIISRLATLILAGSIAALIPAPSTQAENRYWDGGTGNILTNGDGISAGTTGTWDTILLNWDAGAAPHVAWSNANNDTAVFGGTAGTVSLDSNISVGGLTFNTTGYNITTGTNTLTFGGTNNTILFTNIAAATITGAVGGSGNVILSASNPATAGTLTLNGTSAGGWSGTTTINSGMTLALAASNQALLNTTGITLNGGGITLTNVDSAEGAINRISNSAGITSNGGTFNYTNTSGSGLTYAETIGSVDLVKGQTNFVLTNNMAAGNIQTLTLSGLTRTGGNANTSVVTFGSASGLGATNVIKVNGITTSTTGGQIIGPWATVGTPAGGQTDYAIYTSDGTNATVGLASTTLTAPGESGWGSNATAYRVTGAETLTATRTAAALRYTGGALAINLGASNFDLQTNGILNGGSSLTISTTGTGGLTTATSGGNLYLTTGTAAITVSAPIKDNGGAVTVVKSGTGTTTATGTLTLSGTNTYTGGTVINAGRVGITTDANLGAAAGSITFNGGELLINGDFTSTRNVILNPAVGNLILLQGNADWINSGALTGSGGIIFRGNPNGNVTATLTNTANSFTGALGIEAGNVANAVTLNSLSDAVGAGNIVFGAGSTNAQTFRWGGASAITLNNRQIEFGGNGTAAATLTSTGGAINVLSAVSSSGTGAKTLTLGTTAAGSSIGNITDGSGTVNILATNGNWSLTGTNTYSGITSPDNTTLTVLGKSALSANSIISFDSASGSAGGGSGRLNLLMDDSGVVNLGNQVNVRTIQTSAPASWTIFVGNNGGVTTGSTLVLGKMNFANITDYRAAGATLNVQGANGYRLQFGDVDLNYGQAGAQGFNPTTAPITITGTVKQINGRPATGSGSGASLINAGSQVFSLGGTAAGNLISGNIQNASDFPGNANALPQIVTKTGISSWELSGTNTYTGGTNITTGKLLFSGANSLPTTGTVAVGALGHLSLADGTARNSSVSALTLTSLATLSFDWTGNNTGDQLTSTADITLAASSNFAVNLNNRTGTTGGNVTLLTGGGGSNLNLGTAKFYLANATDYTATLSTTATTLSVGSYAAQSALTTIYWAGNKLAGLSTAGVDNAWALSDGTKSNWSSADGTYAATALTPGSTANVIFSNTLTGRAQQSTVLGSDVTVNSVVIADATAVTIAGANGAALTLMSSLSGAGTVGGTPGSAITVTSTANATSTISSRVNLGSNQTWNVASGKTLAVSGIVSGNYSLTKADAGTVNLSGVNTYTGDTTISAGTLTISGTGSLGGGSYAGNISNSGTLSITTSTAQVLSGDISGSGAVNATFATSGTLTLSGNNTYTGKTTIAPGGSGSLATLIVSSINSVNGGTPLLASSSLGAPTDATSGTIQIGAGTSSSATLKYIGTGETTDRRLNFTFNGSSTRTVGVDASGTGPLKFTTDFTGSGTLATLGLFGSGLGEVSGAIGALYTGGGSAPLTKSGTGTWTLSGANTYNAATTVSAGTLVARSQTALGSGASTNVSITAGAALNYVAATDTALNIGGTLTINGGANTAIGGSIGSTATSASINVAGNALVPTAATLVNVYGVAGVSRPAGTTTYTLVSGLGGGATTLNSGTYTLGTVFNNTDFTVANITKSTTGLFIDVTKQTALSGGTFYIGGLAGAGNVWSASNGSTASNFSASSGGAAQALVPGSAASVTVDSNSFATSTVLGADMSISGLTISDNTSNFALNADGYSLTLGSGGITKSNTTTRTATIAANLVLSANQTWSNSDTGNALVVSGIVTGANNLLVTGAGNTTVSGRLMTDAGTLTKQGAGTLTLAANDTYTGTTTVSQGTLLVSGSISGSVATVTGAGSTLGGTGTVGAVTVNTGAILQGGNGVAATGALTSGGNVSLADGSIIKLTLGVAGAHSSLARSGGTWQFDNVGNNQAFSFIGAQVGVYDNIISGLSGSEVGLLSGSSWNFTDANFSYAFTYDGGLGAGNVDLTILAVPEPNVAVSLLGGLGMLVGLRRLRRASQGLSRRDARKGGQDI